MIDSTHATRCLKIRNLLQVAQAVVLAVRERRETRQDHFREDYPLIGNINWLKWVIVRGTRDQMETYLEDVLLEKWKYRPEPEMVDPLLPAIKEG